MPSQKGAGCWLTIRCIMRKSELLILKRAFHRLVTHGQDCSLASSSLPQCTTSPEFEILKRLQWFSRFRIIVLKSCYFSFLESLSPSFQKDVVSCRHMDTTMCEVMPWVFTLSSMYLSAAAINSRIAQENRNWDSNQKAAKSWRIFCKLREEKVVLFRNHLHRYTQVTQDIVFVARHEIVAVFTHNTYCKRPRIDSHPSWRRFRSRRRVHA